MKLCLYVASLIFVCCCLWRQVTGCADNNRNCYQWSRNGECTKNPAYMRQNCKKSCGLCRPAGYWSNWGRWSSCSKSCGTGSRTRRRQCYGSATCYGASFQSQKCTVRQCPASANCVDKNWLCKSWANNGECRRNPRYMVPNCRKSCGLCVVNGNWGSWGRWTVCSKTCDGGAKTRRRTCSNPAPKNGGRTCAGSSTQSQSCNTSPCKVPVNGNWGAWGKWTTCTRTCGGGVTSRSRTCSNPAPQNGGRTCVGPSTQSQSCNTSPCKVNGNWAAWGDWSICSKTCGGGYRRRTRTCTNPAPQHGGQACQGSSYQLANCNTQQCPGNGCIDLLKAWQNEETCRAETRNVSAV